MSEINDIRDLIDKKDEIKDELRRVEYQLAEQLYNFKGTVKEALQARLIRANFSTPPGFYKHFK